ncbi:hypothetical protein [Nocardioides sp.]|uniref:hypothetical protein n=1 Tax=Nocardioides sp. TaxID=35761 RepID=UPI002D7FED11|nr:hypothetical protein [Nocardioides sp.]HET8958862.1 hypothetical protein [Nocardioides sp.]
MTRSRCTVSLAALVLLVSPLAGCASEQEEYCQAVKDHQERLSAIMADGGPTALLEALDSFRELRAEAPSDIDDEWQQVIRSIEALQQALDDAGVDPSDFTGGRPPEGLDQEDREAIAQAANEVGSQETEVALAGVRQQALDVCKTQLWL